MTAIAVMRECGVMTLVMNGEGSTDAFFPNMFAARNAVGLLAKQRPGAEYQVFSLNETHWLSIKDGVENWIGGVPHGE